MTLEEEQVLDNYHSLRTECLENPVFKALLIEVETDILKSVKDSPEAATAAHYELQALERLKGKLTTIEVSYEAIRNQEQ